MAYNESQKRATMKYLKTQKQIRFWVNPDLYSRIQTAAKDGGFTSLRQFYLFAIENLMHNIDLGFRVTDPVNVGDNNQEVVADGANIE